jgi:glycosyltransferase involved in cell wall biosynthesis
MAVSGGAEKVLATVVNNIGSYEVILITFDESRDQFFFKINNSVRVILCKSRLKFQLRFFDYLICIKHLVSLRPDSVIVFNASCYIPLSFFSKFYTSKYIASEHSTYKFFEGSLFRRALLYLSHFFISKYTMLSDNVRLTFPNYVQSKSLIFENPVSYKKIIKSKKLKNSFNLLNIGRLSEEKNHIALIDAVALVLPEISANLTVSIYGEGPLKESLIRRIHERGLGSVVTIYKPVPDLSEVFCQADLFIMPSHYEGFGLAAAEALACGIPVVGYDCCLGLRAFVIDGYNGLLISANSNNHQELAKAIINLLTDRDYLEVLASKANLDGNLSLDNIINKWVKLIEN